MGQKHGVTAIEDYNLISDAVCDNIKDKAKMAKEQGVKYDAIKLEPKVQKCTNQSAIAFHPLMRPFDYFECVKKTQRERETFGIFFDQVGCAKAASHFETRHRMFEKNVEPP